jgi:hypothetical protein
MINWKKITTLNANQTLPMIFMMITRVNSERLLSPKVLTLGVPWQILKISISNLREGKRITQYEKSPKTPHFPFNRVIQNKWLEANQIIFWVPRTMKKWISSLTKLLKPKVLPSLKSNSSKHSKNLKIEISSWCNTSWYFNN